MIKDLAQRAISEETSKKPLVTRMQISYDLKPLTPGCSDIHNKDGYVYTDGLYYLRYKPGHSFEGLRKKFSLTSDLFGSKSYRRFESWDDFVAESKKDPVVNWILNYTHISPEHFQIAKDNFTLMIPIAYDIVKYNNAIKEKVINQTGVEPDYGLLVDPLLVLAEKEKTKTHFTMKNKEIDI